MKLVKPLVVVGLLFLVIEGFAQLSPEQQTIKKVFFDFLQFYQKNEKQFDSFKIKGNKAELLIGSPPWEGATKEERQWSKVPFVKEKGKWVMAGNIDSVDEYNPITL